jgi:hypothetical protein
MNYGCTREFRQDISNAAEELLAAGLDSRTVQLGAPLYTLSEMLDHAIARESCIRVLRHYDRSVRLERGQGLDGLLKRCIEHLRGKGVTKLNLAVFLADLKTFAAEEDEYDPSFIPKKQSLSRRLNTLAHVLGIRLLERTSGHAERMIVIASSQPTASDEDSVPIPSVPINTADSMTGAEGRQLGEDA